MLQELLSRRYYEVFYPKAGSYLATPDHNMWLTSCGAGRFNAADDAPSSTSAGRRMLQLVRSNENW